MTLFKKILIVDDEIKLLQMLSAFLKSSSIEVITTTKAEEAEYAIKNSFFNAVLVDIRLTGVDGREGLDLLTYIKEKSPATRVIVMTAFGSGEIEKEAYANGAYYFFEKPLDLDILKERLEKIGIYKNSIRNA